MSDFCKLFRTFTACSYGIHCKYFTPYQRRQKYVNMGKKIIEKKCMVGRDKIVWSIWLAETKDFCFTIVVKVH